MSFRILSFVACLISCIGLLSSSPSAQSTYKDDFKYTIRTVAEDYLRTKNIWLNNAEPKIKSEYENSILTAEDILIQMCWTQGSLYIPYNDVKRVTEQEIDTFIQMVNKIVLRENIDAKINDLVCDLTHKNGLVKGDLKKHADLEYESRFQKVKTKLNKIMTDDCCSFVYIGEIDKAVCDEFTPLVKRIKAQNKSSSDQSTNGSGGGFWDWLFGTSNTPSPHPTMTSGHKHNKYNDYDQIYRYELDDKVLEISNQILIENNYDVETMPTRVVSDYSDTVQKIVKQAKDELGYGYSIYAYKIKNLAKIALKPIIDKIKYKGEACSICLDEIKSQQKLGVLSCGHFFHKKCIQTSLDYSHKCPLCGTYVNKIDHTEVVPWQ